MDPRRLLILAASGLTVSGCAALGGPAGLSDLSGLGEPGAPPPPAPVAAALTAPPVAVPASPTERPYEPVAAAAEPATAEAPGLIGRDAIASANRAARSPSRSDAFRGGVQVFAWSPGRVFEIWTAPLRVTTLTLSPGEILLSKAAGDTVRWMIGEAGSGQGASARTHVLLKPLERGLETNLILTTDQRVYFIALRSGDPDAFNAAVAWDTPAPVVPVTAPHGAGGEASPVVRPEGPLDRRYRIEPRGRRPRWTPTAVFDDGRRTFIVFGSDLQVREAPSLFVLGADGEAQMTNYRQDGGLFVVDRLFDRAELRLGGRRPQVVRIRRHAGGPS